MTATVTLTDNDQATVRTAAYGAVALMAAAGAPHKGISHGSAALTSATGLVGHVLAAKSRDIQLPGKTTADLADQVLPALTAAVHLLGAHSPTEAANFRDTVLVAVDAAAKAGKREPGPAVAAMGRKIAAALDAA
ncbi:hypothetical protein [Nocardia otitidiscaviarum]|uniref:D-alanyl-D-alanine carboxypeptidase n=1 Tax=Nocardia otitidiscaviarum TaxID=1823 RepID=A0A516NVN5_9NOCA|nr:hypothetical protein [Nocardia otitidiscaviarum]MBF6182890.1 hypothetical protein [Nocardia otitidiscaviarum]MCP9622454.1 hypothetical protein [Nocardia otitidiscaviarum]QDP82969.1 hypothetical protein FOH10_33870 [Nocardia otitidiscaviarum]